MKLLIITAITAFENDIKAMLQKANISTYTFSNVTGFSDISEEAITSNWLALEMNETESILFYAFVRKENAMLLHIVRCNCSKHFIKTTKVIING